MGEIKSKMTVVKWIKMISIIGKSFNYSIPVGIILANTRGCSFSVIRYFFNN